MSEYCRAGGISRKHDRFKDTNTCRFCGENMPHPISNLVADEDGERGFLELVKKCGREKSFSMSQYMKAEDLYKAKAEYYQDLFQRALKELALVEPVIRAELLSTLSDEVGALYKPMTTGCDYLKLRTYNRAIEDVKVILNKPYET